MIVFRPANKTKGPAAGAAIVDGKFLLTADKGPTSGPHEAEVKIVDVPDAAGETTAVTQTMRRSGQLKSFSQRVEIKRGLNEFEFSFTAAPPSVAKSSSK
jgi:hypothetical protein